MTTDFFNLRVRKTVLVGLIGALASKSFVMYIQFHDLQQDMDATKAQISQLQEVKCPTK
jgi:hypothetical protein